MPFRNSKLKRLSMAFVQRLGVRLVLVPKLCLGPACRDERLPQKRSSLPGAPKGIMPLAGGTLFRRRGTGAQSKPPLVATELRGQLRSQTEFGNERLSGAFGCGFAALHRYLPDSRSSARICSRSQTLFGNAPCGRNSVPVAGGGFAIGAPTRGNRVAGTIAFPNRVWERESFGLFGCGFAALRPLRETQSPFLG
jgi:hypothetical protein